MSERDGGPVSYSPKVWFGGEQIAGGSGMTLRDYFAASVIQGAMSASRNTDRGQIYTADASTWAELAYAFADAMLKEREK